MARLGTTLRHPMPRLLLPHVGGLGVAGKTASIACRCSCYAPAYFCACLLDLSATCLCVLPLSPCLFRRLHACLACWLAGWLLAFHVRQSSLHSKQLFSPPVRGTFKELPSTSGPLLILHPSLIAGLHDCTNSTVATENEFFLCPFPCPQVPPDAVEPLLKQLVNQFVHDRARPEVRLETGSALLAPIVATAVKG